MNSEAELNTQQSASKHSLDEGMGDSCACLPQADASIANETTCTSRTLFDEKHQSKKSLSFTQFRLQYLIVFGAIMLADGLQGTHLYALYEGYNLNVANLYAIGFATGAVASPFMGPLVDKFGRRNSALAYCALEMFINALEQYKCITGLLVSRMIGGITTNLLCTVFESWVVTEHRRRGFQEQKLEIILRDSVIISNVLAIASGIIAELLVNSFGLTGPFKGAVCCTFLALTLVWAVWGENYGSDNAEQQRLGQIMRAAVNTIISDSRICRLGIIQGLTQGALQTFIFLWCPALLLFSREYVENQQEGPAIWQLVSSLAKTKKGEPAFGFIFGTYMAAGAIGGWMFPVVRHFFGMLFAWIQGGAIVNITDVDQQLPLLVNDSLHQISQSDSSADLNDISDESSVSSTTSSSHGNEEKSYAAETLAALCYAMCAGLLAIPAIVGLNPNLFVHKFEISLISFVLYEILVGIYLPCEGILRTKYMPNDSICSVMTMLRIIVNLAVAFGVFMTNVVTFTTAFGLCSGAFAISCILQLSLVEFSAFSQGDFRLVISKEIVVKQKTKQE